MQHEAKAVCLLFLLLSGHALAVRVKTHHLDLVQESEKTLRKDEFWDAVAKGREVEATVNCTHLPKALATEIAYATKLLRHYCPDGLCTFMTATWPVKKKAEEAFVHRSLTISALTGMADKKYCLAETMKSLEVQKAESNLTEAFDMVLNGASSDQKRTQMAQAISNLHAWKEALPKLAGTVLDRKELFPDTIEDPDECPKPCISCSRTHRSMYKGEEKFSFKCILNVGTTRHMMRSSLVRNLGAAGPGGGKAKLGAKWAIGKRRRFSEQRWRRT